MLPPASHHRPQSLPVAGVSPEGREHLRVTGLTLAYGDFLVLRDIDFTVGRGEIFIIMGVAGAARAPCCAP